MRRMGRGLSSVLLGSLCLCNILLAAEHRNPADAGEHIIAVVPLIGAGTPDDPVRPMFLPKPRDVQAALIRGEAPSILSSHFTLADDGKTAIVEFAASDRQSYKPILDAAAAGSITAFDLDKVPEQDLNQRFQRWKKGFDLAAFRNGPFAAAGQGAK